MRKAMAVLLTAGFFGVTGAVALAQTGSIRDGKDGGVSFKLATERPARGFEAVDVGGGRTLYVAGDAVLTGADVASADSVAGRTGPEVKLAVTSDGINRLQTQMRATGADHMAVYATGKLIAAGAMSVSQDRVSISGLTDTQVTRLTRVLTREGNVVPAGAVVTLVPSQSSVAPGGSVNVDVFVSNVSDLRSYQVVLAINGGNGGTINVSDLQIDANRGDHVFANQQKFDAVDTVGGRIGSVIMAGGVNVANQAYLGSFTLAASNDATGTFNVKVDQAGRASLLFSSQNNMIEFSSPTLSLNVGGKPGSIRGSRD